MKIGFVAGAFDLLHCGHIRMLKDARTHCDRLIVGLHVDPSIERPDKNKPVQSLGERAEQLEACRYVDVIFVYKTEANLRDILQVLQPDVRILGTDWRPWRYTGFDLDIPIYWHKRDYPYSTSELRERIYQAERAKRETAR